MFELCLLHVFIISGMIIVFVLFLLFGPSYISANDVAFW